MGRKTERERQRDRSPDSSSSSPITTGDPNGESSPPKKPPLLPSDRALGLWDPLSRPELDRLLDRLVLDARAAFETGGKVTFDFKRRQAVLTIKWPSVSILEDFEGSDG